MSTTRTSGRQRPRLSWTNLEWRRFNRVGGNLIRPLEAVAAARNETTENEAGHPRFLCFRSSFLFFFILFFPLFFRLSDASPARRNKIKLDARNYHWTDSHEFRRGLMCLCARESFNPFSIFVMPSLFVVTVNCAAWLDIAWWLENLASTVRIFLINGLLLKYRWVLEYNISSGFCVLFRGETSF